MSIWLTAIVMGLAGSLHCLGMCSPLVMAATARKPFLLNKVLYNAGRVLVYGILGAFAAALGSQMITPSIQDYFSILIGILMLLIAMGIVNRISIPWFDNVINGYIRKLKSYFGEWLHSKNGSATFILGLLNGLLPCGLTYMAVAYCLILPAAMDGFFFMLLFGLGTWPVMVAMTWVVGLSFKKELFNYQRATASVFFVCGILLIVRVFITMQHAPLAELDNTTTKAEVVCK